VALHIMFALAPAQDIVKCSRVEYRQAHLAECNAVPSGYGRGGRGGGDGGLLGGLLGGLTGGLL
jgi:hypothetical protein